MLPIHRLQVEQSEKRQRINAILVQDEVADEERAELGALTERAQQIEVELRAALVAQGEAETHPVTQDAEFRERLELRSRARLTNYVLSALLGRLASGAEAELQAAAGVTQIPIELFDVEQRADMATVSPTSGTGVNLDPIYPLIYARSVLPRVGVAMPRVGSGGYSSMTITTGLSAAAVVAGAAQESTPATLTPKSTTPHRISARLSLRIEDIATIGAENFE